MSSWAVRIHVLTGTRQGPESSSSNYSDCACSKATNQPELNLDFHQLRFAEKGLTWVEPYSPAPLATWQGKGVELVVTAAGAESVSRTPIQRIAHNRRAGNNLATGRKRPQDLPGRGI
jgi:hypothetical protein